MDLDELQSIQNRERQTDSLQSLRGSFYEEVGEYVQRLREKRERVAEEEGFDAPEFRRLSDEIDTAEDTVESIYERRVGKIVKAASFSAAGMPADDEGLTDEEQALFDQLVADIEGNREHVLAVLAGDIEPDVAPPGTRDDLDDETPPAPDPDPDPDPNPADGGDAGVDAADVMGDDSGTRRTEVPEREQDESRGSGSKEEQPVNSGASGHGNDQGDTAGGGLGSGEGQSTEPEAASAPPSGGTSAMGNEEQTGKAPSAKAQTPDKGQRQEVDRATVLITRDVGEILGVDERAYDLGQDDVVELPEANATPLVERDAAKRLE